MGILPDIFSHQLRSGNRLGDVPLESSRQSYDLMPGGRGDNRPDSMFDPEQLHIGMRIEMEHTRDPRIAKEVAKDHLMESKDYYRHLQRMETQFSALPAEYVTDSGGREHADDSGQFTSKGQGASSSGFNDTTPEDAELSMWGQGRDINDLPKFIWVSRSGRFSVRTGNYGTMVVTDNRNGGKQHLVVGKIPEVIDTIKGKRPPATDEDVSKAMRATGYSRYMTDSHGLEHADDSGQFTSGGGGSAASPDKERSLLARVKEVPGQMMDWATGFISDKYRALEAKYGSTGAKAVLASMILLTPVPMPGTSLLPIAVAEAVRRIGRMFGPEPVMNADLGFDPDAIAAAILEEMGITPDEGQTDYSAVGPMSQFDAAHAPSGGVTIRGKFFRGGQFIPGEVMAKASPEERAAVEGGKARGKPLPPKTGIVAPKQAPHGPAPGPAPGAPPSPAWGSGAPDEPFEVSPWLSDEEKALERYAQEFARANFPKLKEQYLIARDEDGELKNAAFDENGNVKSVILNTDEWRELMPGYVGTNAGAIHAASAWCNKRMMNDALKAQRGKGNNKFMVLAGGGGSGKGTATKDYFIKSEYPIVLDQVSDQLQKLESKLDEAKDKYGYDPVYVFVDRPPEGAAGGIVGRALNLRKKGLLARTVNIDIGLKANIDSRRTALELLKRRTDIEPNVIDNRGGAYKRRLITDRAEAISYLEQRLAEDEAKMAGGLRDQIRNDIITRARSGEIPPDLAEGFLGRGWDSPAPAPTPSQQTPLRHASASAPLRVPYPPEGPARWLRGR